MISLRFRSGPRRGSRVDFNKDRVIFGRSSIDADVVIEDPGVADVHCQLTRVGDQFELLSFDPANPRGKRYEAGEQFIVGATTIEIVASAWTRTARRRSETNRWGDPADRPATGARDRPPIRPDGPGRPEVRPPAGTPVRAIRGIQTPRQGSGTLLDDSPTQVDLKAPLLRGETTVTLIPSDCVVINSLEAAGDPADVLGEHDGKSRLIFLTGPHKDRYVFLGRRRAVMGRSEDAHVPISDSRLEAHHAAILAKEDDFIIRKLSDAPVLLNGKPIMESRMLGQGDIITLGSSDIEFQRGDVDLDSGEGLTTIAIPAPRFAFAGQVRMQQKLLIGREPSADLFLDDRRIERRHAEIYFAIDQFRLKDLSTTGTRINGKRAVDEQLRDGDAVQLGAFELRLRIKAFRCSVEIIPPEPDREIPRYVNDGAAGGDGLETMYRLPPGRQDELASIKEEEREEKDRESVLWVTPDDVKRNMRHPLVFATGMAVSLVVAYLGFAEAGGQALLNRPNSAVHESVAFQNEAGQKLDGHQGCVTCHGSRPTVVEACRACHEPQPLRPMHASVDAATCSACHSEHRAATKVALVPSERCIDCHEDRHARFRPFDPEPVEKTEPEVRAGFLVDLRADLSFEEAPRIEALHLKHARVKARCRACHLGADGKERPEGEAYRSCFGCHGPAEALAAERCADCHREHSDRWAKPPPKAERAEVLFASSDNVWPLASLTMLGMLFFVGLTLGAHQVSRRLAERSREEAEPPPPPRTDGLIECGGSGRGMARKLPRVSKHRCTGSGDCADACPYDVLHMENGLPTVARPELCHECMTCVSVCGPQALSMAAPGEPPPMISVPSLDANFQTGLGDREDGIYIIGDAAGKPLVKNGNNLGRWVIEHMVSEGLRPKQAAELGFMYEVIILGSGPAGLSAAICALEAGLSCIILEKQHGFATTIQSYPRKKRLMPVPENVENVGPLPVWDGSREEILQKWKEKLSGYDLKIENQVQVSAIQADQDGFVVESQKGTYRGLRVVIASGARGDPRRLGKPGDDLPKVHYRLVDPADHHHQQCMVVGGGDSALEAACELAEANGGSNRVSIVYRQDRFTRAKKGNQERIAKLIQAGRITAFMETNPIEVKEKSVVLERKRGATESVPNDVLFCMLGANPPTKWLEQLGVEIVQKPADWDPGRSDQFAFQNFSREDNPA